MNRAKKKIEIRNFLLHFFLFSIIFSSFIVSSNCAQEVSSLIESNSAVISMDFKNASRSSTFTPL